MGQAHGVLWITLGIDVDLPPFCRVRACRAGIVPQGMAEGGDCAVIGVKGWGRGMGPPIHWAVAWHRLSRGGRGKNGRSAKGWWNRAESNIHQRLAERAFRMMKRESSRAAAAIRHGWFRMPVKFIGAFTGTQGTGGLGVYIPSQAGPDSGSGKGGIRRAASARMKKGE
jgi:hypothetical protein